MVLLKALLDASADMHCQAGDGSTVLDVAARSSGRRQKEAWAYLKKLEGAAKAEAFAFSSECADDWLPQRLASKKKSKKSKKGKPITAASSSTAPASGSWEQTEPTEDEAAAAVAKALAVAAAVKATRVTAAEKAAVAAKAAIAVKAAAKAATKAAAEKAAAEAAKAAAALLQAHEAKLRSAIESSSLSVLDQAIRMAPHEANASAVGAEARALRDKLVEVGLAAEQKARREAAEEAAHLAAWVGSLDVNAGVLGAAVVAVPLVCASEVVVSLSELCSLTSDFEESHKVCQTSAFRMHVASHPHSMSAINTLAFATSVDVMIVDCPATHGRWAREDSAASSRPPVSVASRP